jgi:hypothetical protein
LLLLSIILSNCWTAQNISQTSLTQINHGITLNLEAMAAHTFTKDAGAALVFAILYSILFIWMLAGYITGRFKVRSRWSLLFFHVTIRVVSQVGLS